MSAVNIKIEAEFQICSKCW